MNVAMHGDNGLRSEEGDDIVMGRVNVVEGIYSGLHVSNGRFITVGRKEGVNSREVRVSREGQPTYTSNKTLICLSPTNEGREIIWFIRRCDRVNRNTQAIWCSCGSWVA